MKRVKPCQNCKKRRRKCERKENKLECERCIRLKLICSFDTTHYDPFINEDNLSQSDELLTMDNLPEVDGNSTLGELYQHVQQMEKDMELLQLELNKQQKNQQQLVPSSIKRRKTDNNNNNSINDGEHFAIPSQWKLSIVNGQLRLETGINSLGELLNIGYKQTIRSLSPFDNQPCLRFQIISQESFISKVSTLFNKYELFNSDQFQFQRKNSYTHHLHHHHHHHNNNNNNNNNNNEFIAPLITHQHHDQSTSAITISWENDQNNILSNLITTSSSSCSTLSSSSSCSSTTSSPSSTLLLSPPSTYCGDIYHSSTSDFAFMIDKMIVNYFTCQNVAMPLVHQPTFMERYQQYELMNQQGYQHFYFSGTTEPIVDYLIKNYSPLTLAICCFMTSSFCEHIDLTSSQKRDYGELFYLACKDRIYDMLDDPDQQLNGLMCINFILKFMMLTLRLKEARRLTTFGYLMTCEFKHANPSDYSQVEQAMMQRHGIMINIVYAMSEFICQQQFNEDITPKKCPLFVLPDENKNTLQTLKLYQHFIEMALYPITKKMIEQLRFIVFGRVGSISLHDILDFEQACLHWWRTIPSEWRYCDQPFDTKLATMAIEQCTDVFPLIAHTFLLTMMVGIYTGLSHPQSLDDQITLTIQHKATEIILNCCELLMAAADRMKKVTNICGYSCEYIFRVIDSLIVLGEQIKNQRNNNVDVELVLNKIKECSAKFNLMAFEGHEVPVGISLFAKDNPSSTDDAISMYNKYPFPGYALIFDLLSTSARSLGISITKPL
ncbi:hypothetical protein BJ944DRAFT_285905 [Cunninghamella echinulata]|nr:hypothetical protein BJ944DRAFT_285905 [Cunninghamella echinulata]